MNIHCKITILLSAHNEEKTIKSSIQSIIQQTFTNWKLVIIDDCSSDGTHSIAQQYADAYPDKIYVHKNSVNMKLAASLNIGANLCTAKYIARMDADDICKPYRLQKQFDFLEANPDIALVSGAMEYIDEHGTPLGRTYPITSPKKIRKKILNAGNVIVHPAVMMRRDAFEVCGGYCEALTTGQDQHLWMKFLRKGYKLAMLPTPMISYRVRGNAISSRVKTDEQVRLMKEILEYDDPPKELIDAFRKEVEKSKGQFVSSQSRKAQIENSMHCKIWRMSRKLRIPEKVVEKVVCGVQNVLA
jgi:glycosyltransferase EpsE